MNQTNPYHKATTCIGCAHYYEQCVSDGVWNPNAKITFIGESPSWASIGSNAPMQGPNGILLRKVIAAVEHNFKDKNFKLEYNFAYAGAAMGHPSKLVISQCGSLWRARWLSNYNQGVEEHVIVPLGSAATKSAGVQFRKLADIRGRLLIDTLGDRQVHILPTFSLNHIYAKPGLVTVLIHDITKAINLAYFNTAVEIKPIEEISKEYVFPKTIEEVKQICDYIVGYYDPAKQNGPAVWPISVDTETNTLKPHSQNAKVLMVSMAWDDRKATAIMLDHPETPYDAKEAWEHVRRVLECAKPKVFHNAKFDLQFLEKNYGIKVNNVIWDTMTGQHWLAEDQRGLYGLKHIAPMYAPEYEGYEDELHKVFRKTEKTAAELYEEQYKEELETSETSAWLETDLDEEYEEEEEVQEEKSDPNELYRSDVLLMGLTDEDAILAYKQARDAWFMLDAQENGKARGSMLRKWKKAAKKLGLPVPQPVPTKKVKEKVKKNNGFEDVAVETLLPYAAADADVTRIILKQQFKKLTLTNRINQAHQVMDALYIPGTRALGDLEYRGVTVDLDKAREYDSQLSIIMDECVSKIYNLSLREFNIRSKDQLIDVLSSMGFPRIKETKTHKMSTDKGVLTTYQESALANIAKAPSEIDQRKLEFIENVMRYNAANKMKSSFLRNLRDLAALDGKIHTTFHLTGTTTGRLSSARLNLQNLPHFMCEIKRPNGSDSITVHEGFNVKALLIPDSPDQVFWNLDIKAAEIRVLCYYSGDPDLIKAVNDGLDIHTYFMSRIKHPQLVGDELLSKYREYKMLVDSGDHDLNEFRIAVKRVVFGTLYGAGPKKIATQIGGDFTQENAKALINSFFKAFPKISDYVDLTKLEAVSKGEVNTVFNRYRRFAMVTVSSALRSKAEREAVNFKIQSTSSDLVLSQLCEINDNLHTIGAEMKLTVHDSMAGVIHKSRVPEMKAFFDYWLVKRIQERFPWLPVPFSYDLEIGPNYGQKIKWKDWVAQNNIIAA